MNRVLKGGQTKTVLVVDDNATIGKIVGGMIKTFHPNAVIVHAEHGAHACEIIARGEKKFNIAIIDVEMRPDMSGAELLDKILGKHPDIHVILMSGKAEPKGHKAHAFFRKTDGIVALLKIIENFPKKS